MEIEEKCFLDKITYEFSQEGNTEDTTEENELLTVEVQSCCGSIIDEGGFIVIRTSTGWSINDPSELTDLLGQVKYGIGSYVIKKIKDESK